MLGAGQGVQDAIESVHINFKVTIIKYDAHAHIIHLLVLVYMLECVPKR